MTVRHLVVDTSALVDAIDVAYPEWGETFRYLQGRYPIQAPRLIESEAGNVVHAKHPGVFGDDARERSQVVEDLLEGIDPVDPSPLSRDRCGTLVERTDLTFYDAQFLELADRDDDRLLLTQDGPLLDAARDLLGEDRALDLDAAGDAIAAGQL